MPFVCRRAGGGAKRVYNNGVLVSGDETVPVPPRWRPAVPVPPAPRQVAAEVRAPVRGTSDAPVPGPHPACAAWELPRALRLAGNVKAWLEFATMLRGVRTVVTPILVHGPVGCGKTYGVESVCSGLELRRFVVDAAMMHREVLDVFDHLCGASCFGQRAVLHVEDADGMAPDMLACIDQALARFPNVLVVATACNRYSLRLSKWRGWREVRLYRPRAADVERLVMHMHPQAELAVVASLARGCAGDMRRCLLAVAGRTAVATIDAQHTIFEGTQSLFARTQSAVSYADEFGDEKRICTELAFRNYLDVGQGKMDLAHVAHVADAFSVAAWAACEASWLTLCGHLCHMDDSWYALSSQLLRKTSSRPAPP